ncbi:hypothetical protein COU59_01525 [Candidatus Pacearchaeota archaeon CG10_big_fil_rev_8_21_14_0_10_34_12]|nr:MAG: hypothetical protein COU59_01525 [Candidatus Pacearchaeota archaeon CG10_big_fil_rev_8_21_14_0_10_34_12]
MDEQVYYIGSEIRIPFSPSPIIGTLEAVVNTLENPGIVVKRDAEPSKFYPLSKLPNGRIEQVELKGRKRLAFYVGGLK